MIVGFHRTRILAALALFTTTACISKAGEVGALPDDGGLSSGAESGDGSTGEVETTSGTGETGDLPAPSCEDIDGDDIAFSEDNAVEHFNPSQADIDQDGIGDVVDLCPTIAGPPTNTADSDRDGVGNDCDTCRQSSSQYNDGAAEAGIPAYMQIRNIPDQSDIDEDGIGDACDNCVWTPNCEGYGADDPYRVGDPIAYDDAVLCQTDDDSDFVGDACAGMMVRPDAAGPIGFGETDDFDQDGIRNMLDACPRLPIVEADMIACGGPGDCADGRSCDDGWCNHLDSDQDAVGDACDTCPYAANPNQVLEGGQQEDDEDEDFVGQSCETAPACSVRSDARPFGFFAVQAEGNCCTVALVESQADFDPGEGPAVVIGDLLDARTCGPGTAPSPQTCEAVRVQHPEDPAATLPLRRAENCPQEQVGGVWVCRQLPPVVENAPGILVPPPGCEAALSAAGLTAVGNVIAPLNDADFGGDMDTLWQNQCFLPQFDQDFDGLGDPCDLCPFAYDPDNTQYVDDTGRLWPNDGAMCNGDFACG